MSDTKHCPACNAPRQGDTCHKCGADTITPCEGWHYPVLPPVSLIRSIARKVGYAIGEHGTKERDLDLIAAPWGDDAVSQRDLINHIAEKLGARVVEVEEKPLGRIAATIQMEGYFKPIDLSVCPAMPELKRFDYCPSCGGLDGKHVSDCKRIVVNLVDNPYCLANGDAPPKFEPIPREYLYGNFDDARLEQYMPKNYRYMPLSKLLILRDDDDKFSKV